MEPFTSPKITVGVQCLRIRTKRMYVAAMVDPDEARFYDPYEGSAYWCVQTQSGFGPDGQPVRPEDCRGGRGCCML